MYICKDCFRDEELRSEVSSNAILDGECNVCGANGKIMDSSEFYGFFDALLSLFTSSDKSNKTIVDIIQDEWNLFRDKDVARVLLSDVIETHVYDFTIDSTVDYISDIIERVKIWDRLKKDVREKYRFFTDMKEFNDYNYLTSGMSLHIGQKLYRSRITPKDQKKIKCNKMGCPPRELASAGRANPIGIPYLYLSDTAKTTY